MKSIVHNECCVEWTCVCNKDLCPITKAICVVSKVGYNCYNIFNRYIIFNDQNAWSFQLSW